MAVLSIIVPVYNVEKFLQRSIESILKQTYKDFECIIVDDGSTDGSGKICDEYAEKDKRISVIHKENGGVSSARNVGLEKSSGKYIGFIDPDDWIEADMYQKLINKIEQDKSDICIGGFISDRIILKKECGKLLSPEEALGLLFECKLFTCSLCDKIYKKFLFDHLKFDEAIKVGEDLLMNWMVFRRTKSISYFPVHLYHYSFRKSSITRSSFSVDKLTCIDVIKMIRREADSMSLKIKKNVEQAYASMLVCCAREILIFDPIKYEKELKEIQIKVRRNAIVFFGVSDFRIKFGILFLCLPYTFCLWLRYNIKNRKLLNFCSIKDYDTD